MFSGLRSYHGNKDLIGTPMFSVDKDALGAAAAGFNNAKEKGSKLGLNGRESAHIYAYCGPYYNSLNRPLRNKVATLRGLKFAKETNKALDKLPNYDGVVYRKTDLPADEFAKLIPGYVFTELGFTSSSKNSHTWHGEHHFVINSKTGKDVSKISPHGAGESEVLFKHGSHFYVTKKEGNTIYVDEVGYD
jgi:hypothetical protein